jgi:hypothetical protein
MRPNPIGQRPSELLPLTPAHLLTCDCASLESLNLSSNSSFEPSQQSVFFFSSPAHIKMTCHSIAYRLCPHSLPFERSGGTPVSTASEFSTTFHCLPLSILTVFTLHLLKRARWLSANRSAFKSQNTAQPVSRIPTKNTLPLNATRQPGQLRHRIGRSHGQTVQAHHLGFILARRRQVQGLSTFRARLELWQEVISCRKRPSCGRK